LGDCKSLKIKNARHTHITNEKKYGGFGGRPPVGGRPAPPLNPALEVAASIKTVISFLSIKLYTEYCKVNTENGS